MRTLLAGMVVAALTAAMNSGSPIVSRQAVNDAGGSGASWPIGATSRGSSPLFKHRPRPQAAATTAAMPDLNKDLAQFVGTSTFTVGKTFRTGFESQSDFASFYIVPQDHMGTASHALSTEVVHAGAHSHKGWIHGANPVKPGENTNHRAYPTIQLFKTREGTYHNMVLTELWVWLDVSLERRENEEWVSLATFTPYADVYWGRSILVNLTYDGIVRLQHVPDQGEAILDIYQTRTTTFPMRQWVKLDVLLDFSADNEYRSPYAKVWQDGTLVSAARFNPRVTIASLNAQKASLPCLKTWDGSSVERAESLCGAVYTGGLAQAHFGLYAPPLLASGTVYNDDLAIYEIDRN